ncbi:MAG TPA: hypothetical protein VGQ69_12460 [Gemmatimonadales bacterium]|nr:hypothetical protein [Gemmatimonadales bacterium]
MRVIALGVLVILLLVTGYNGLVEGVIATHHAGTAGMRVATVTQLLYGVCAVVALLALAAKQRWVLWPVAGWALAVIATAGLAPVVYGGTPVRTGLVAGAGAALVLGLVLWAWRRSS